MKVKSRNLPYKIYLLELEKEYLINKYRKKIYLKKKDIDFYEKVCKFKMDKILDLSFKIDSRNIFDDMSRYYDIYSNLFNEFKTPLFLNENDKIVYYDKKNIFTYKNRKIIKIIFINVKTDKALILLDKKRIFVDLKFISRKFF